MTPAVAEFSPQLAARVAAIQPFYVMELAREAAKLERAGRDIIHMGIGEPDFTAPEPVVEAATAALRKGATQYTSALGLFALREAIAAHYGHAYALKIDPARVIVTAGASAALLLACVALVERDAEVLMPDPCYPCNRHFVIAADGHPVLVPSGPDARFQLRAAEVERAWTPRTRGVLLASPSNPTGTRRSRRPNCSASCKPCAHAAASPSSMKFTRASATPMTAPAPCPRWRSAKMS